MQGLGNLGEILTFTWGKVGVPGRRCAAEGGSAPEATRHCADVPAKPHRLPGPNPPLILRCHRDASEPGIREGRESCCHSLPQVLRNVPFVKHQIPGSDRLLLWLELGTRAPGSPCQGVLRAAFLPAPQGKWQLLILWGVQSIGQSQHTLGPADKIIFSKHAAPPSPLSGLQVAAPLLGNGVLSVRSAQGLVQGDFIRSSPICLCKHLHGL